ncbi:uncharacterized protein LOC125204433 [Salvia hispanica]|uniref:uncharacterized protein LOC125204433 n=1 Tax=Salvia hispanica TaxID=49212 RepID=UPI0020091A90|nr:uncharacterized protein LOC125204433 [Salvia hispanica]
MAATPLLLLLPITTLNSPQQASIFRVTMSSCLSFFLLLTLSILLFTLYTIFKNHNGGKGEEGSVKIQSLPENAAERPNQETGREPGPGSSARSLLLEILPPEWEALLGGGEGAGEESGPGREDKKRRRKRARKKKAGPSEEEEEGRKGKEELVCLYPFTKSCSATQRKIKQQYDQLVKSHGSNGLTLDQVGQFVNCLVEARNELQSKSEVIKRRFTITKALLFKADRSSFDRLRQQIYKLELEQKRLEEDAFVYNWLQQQLKVSPAYKKMLEISACMETKAKSSSPEESQDASFCDISFEELLAQEKKDAFWQRNGKLRTCSG